jgi:hypothetical protein
MDYFNAWKDIYCTKEHGVEKIGEKIGQGGYGAVYVACKSQNDCEYVLKVVDISALYKIFHGNYTMEELFSDHIYEVKVQQDVAARGLAPKVLASWRCNQYYLIFSERFDTTLLNYVRKEKFDIRTAEAQAIVDAYRGLAKLGYSQNDAKMDNIVVNYDDQGIITVNIIDFGLTYAKNDTNPKKGWINITPKSWDKDWDLFLLFAHVCQWFPFYPTKLRALLKLLIDTLGNKIAFLNQSHIQNTAGGLNSRLWWNGFEPKDKNDKSLVDRPAVIQGVKYLAIFRDDAGNTYGDPMGVAKPLQMNTHQYVYCQYNPKDITPNANTKEQPYEVLHPFKKAAPQKPSDAPPMKPFPPTVLNVMGQNAQPQQKQKKEPIFMKSLKDFKGTTYGGPSKTKGEDLFVPGEKDPFGKVPVVADPDDEIFKKPQQKPKTNTVNATPKKGPPKVPPPQPAPDPMPVEVEQVYQIQIYMYI